MKFSFGFHPFHHVLELCKALRSSVVVEHENVSMSKNTFHKSPKGVSYLQQVRLLPCTHKGLFEVAGQLSGILVNTSYLICPPESNTAGVVSCLNSAGSILCEKTHKCDGQ